MSLQALMQLVIELDHVTSLDRESYQLGKHDYMPYPVRANKRTNSPFTLVNIELWVSVK